MLDANGINYESIENNILNIKYKDLKYIRDSLSGWLIDSNKGDTTEFYKNLITYSDPYYNRTKSQYIDSFDNTSSEGGTLFSYCDIEQNVDTQNKYDNYTYNDYFDIDITYKEEVEESYTTTIEGTSDKINDNKEKTDKNENEIEKLKTAVSKNKDNISKLKQKVTSITNKVGAMSNSLGAAKTDIAKLDIRVTNLENSGSSGSGMTNEQKQQLEQNTRDISTLKTNVSKNTQNISTNKTNIDNLTTRVSNLENSGGSGSGITEEERQQIQTNKTDIANNTKNISTNKTDISTLKTNVSNNTTEIDTLKTNVSNNKTDINNLKTNTDTNTTDISKLKTNVSNNTQNISTNATNITNLTTRVSNLENSGGSGSGITETERQQIQTNKTDIANLTTRVSNLENSGGSGSGITETERQQIQTNKTDIAKNIQNISTNKNNIDNLTTRVTNLEEGCSSGSGITEEERQQIQTNKTDIDNLTTNVSSLETNVDKNTTDIDNLTTNVSSLETNVDKNTTNISTNTTNIEDILRRLEVLEQGGGGVTEEALKFTSFDIKFNKDKSNASYYFPSFDLNNYKIDDTYYLSETNSSQLYYCFEAILNKTNSRQTFRYRHGVNGSDYTIIDRDTLNLQSSNIEFIYANSDIYFDCESSLNDLYAKSNSIHIKTYKWLEATRDTYWINETTGNKVTSGAHEGDIINLKTKITGGFKALNLENAPSELNKYYYKIIFSSSSTNHNNSNAVIVADWTHLNVEPNVLTDIKFTFNKAWGGKTVNLFISDGQYVIRADYDRIPLLT